MVFPTIKRASISSGSKVTAFREKSNYCLLLSIIFITMVSVKQLRFVAMASPASRVPMRAAWLSAAPAAVRAAEAGPGLSA